MIHLIRPIHRGHVGIVEVQATEPFFAVCGILSVLNLGGETRGQLMSPAEGRLVVITHHFLENARIPDTVQIHRLSVPFYKKFSSALASVFRV